MSLTEPMVRAFEAPGPRTSDPDTLLAAAAAAMLDHGLAAETRRIYLTWMRRLLTSSRRGPAEDPAESVAAELGRLAAFGGLGASSLKQARAAARLLLRVVPGRPDDAPQLRIVAARVAPAPVLPSRDEVLRLLATCRSARDRLLIGLICGSGLRLGEALRLCAADLDVRALRVRVPPTGGRPGREARLAPCLAATAGAHLDGRMPWDWVFTTRDGHRLSLRGAQRAIERAAARCGLGGRIHSRSLRRGFGRVLEEEVGVPGGIGSPL